MSSSGQDKSSGRTFSKTTTIYRDAKDTNGRNLDLHFKLDHIFHKEADPVRQLLL
ncbi:hypothetical protein BGW41_007066, partial [Actinomortierella wolfii]